MVVSHPPSCLPSLATGLVPVGQHYYEGSDSLAEHRSLLLTRVSLLIAIEFPIIPSPTTTWPFHDARFGTLRFDHRRRRCTALRYHPPLGVEPRLGRKVQSGVRELPGRSPTGLAESSSQYCYGLIFRLRLLSTLSFENAVAFNYRDVTNSLIGTFTRLFNRLHRRTGSLTP
jgi:hypothetical protein